VVDKKNVARELYLLIGLYSNRFLHSNVTNQKSHCVSHLKTINVVVKFGSISLNANKGTQTKCVHGLRMK
jgi:hypothetical protein